MSAVATPGARPSVLPPWPARHNLAGGGAVAYPRQSRPIFRRERLRLLDGGPRLLELPLNLVDVGKRPPDLVGQGGVPLEEVRPLGPHPLEHRAQHCEVTGEPRTGGTKLPNPILLRPSALPVSMP